MLQCTIPIAAIRATLPAAAKSDIRYYLVGVLIEHLGAETRAIATDGHRMHCYRFDQLDDAGNVLPRQPAEQVIMPREMAEKLAKYKPAYKGGADTVTIETAETDGHVWITATLPEGAKLTQRAIDGTFPDYRRVLPPAGQKNEPADILPGVNADYARDAAKCAAMADGYADSKLPAPIRWQYYNLDSKGVPTNVFLAAGLTFVAVIMAVRDCNGDAAMPAVWAER